MISELIIANDTTRHFAPRTDTPSCTASTRYIYSIACPNHGSVSACTGLGLLAGSLSNKDLTNFTPFALAMDGSTTTGAVFLRKLS